MRYGMRKTRNGSTNPSAGVALFKSPKGSSKLISCRLEGVDGDGVVVCVLESPRRIVEAVRANAAVQHGAVRWNVEVVYANTVNSGPSHGTIVSHETITASYRQDGEPVRMVGVGRDY